MLLVSMFYIIMYNNFVKLYGIQWYCKIDLKKIIK